MANSMLYICYHEKKNFPSKKNKKPMCRIASIVARGNKRNLVYRTVWNLASLLDKNDNICKWTENLQNMLFKRIHWLPTTNRLIFKLFYRRCNTFSNLVPTYPSKPRLVPRHLCFLCNYASGILTGPRTSGLPHTSVCLCCSMCLGRAH